MRITGGKYTNRRVECPRGIIRPAMDRMRESMFSILGPLDGKSFLDLFSGSGVVGLEAASRGADPVVLVEMDGKKRPVILQNLKISEKPIKLIIRPAERYLKSTAEPFDIVYLDPPFNYKRKTELLALVSGSNAVKNGALVLLHHPAEDNIPAEIEGLQLTDTRTYGRSILKFYLSSASK